MQEPDLTQTAIEDLKRWDTLFQNKFGRTEGLYVREEDLLDEEADELERRRQWERFSRSDRDTFFGDVKYTY